MMQREIVIRIFMVPACKSTVGFDSFAGYFLWVNRVDIVMSL